MASFFFFPLWVGICSLPSLLTFGLVTRQSVDDEVTSKDRIDGATDRMNKE